MIRRQRSSISSTIWSFHSHNIRSRPWPRPVTQRSRPIRSLRKFRKSETRLEIVCLQRSGERRPIFRQPCSQRFRPIEVDKRRTLCRLITWHWRERTRKRGQTRPNCLNQWVITARISKLIRQIHGLNFIINNKINLSERWKTIGKTWDLTKH